MGHHLPPLELLPQILGIVESQLLHALPNKIRRFDRRRGLLNFENIGLWFFGLIACLGPWIGQKVEPVDIDHFVFLPAADSFL
jgi:hypothetical protein